MCDRSERTWSRNFEVAQTSVETATINSILTGGKIINYIESDNSSDPITLYCGYEGSKLNRFLRGMKDCTKNLKKYNIVLSILLLHSPRLPEDIVTYIFVPDEAIQDILQENKEEHVLSNCGFTSQ